MKFKWVILTLCVLGCAITISACSRGKVTTPDYETMVIENTSDDLLTITGFKKINDFYAQLTGIVYMEEEPKSDNLEQLYNIETYDKNDKLIDQICVFQHDMIKINDYYYDYSSIERGEDIKDYILSLYN